MKISKVVVTGATGMIAISLIKELISDGIIVYAVVRPGSKNISRLPDSSFIEVIECDLSKINSLVEVLGRNIDLFYHFGWEASTVNRDSDFDAQILNIKYTLDAYKTSEKLGCKKFIGAGSQAEYGQNFSNELVTEKTIPNPSTPYGIAKFAAFKMIQAMSKQISSTGFIWTRIFSVYGTNDHEHTLINSLINSDNTSEFNLSSCEQTWNYLHEKDAGNAFYRLGLFGRTSEVYNIANNESKRLKVYINSILSLLKHNVTLNFGIDDNNNNLKPCIKKLMEDTGFIPKISFEDGIVKLIGSRLNKNE